MNTMRIAFTGIKGAGMKGVIVGGGMGYMGVRQQQVSESAAIISQNNHRLIASDVTELISKLDHSDNTSSSSTSDKLTLTEGNKATIEDTLLLLPERLQFGRQASSTAVSRAEASELLKGAHI